MKARVLHLSGALAAQILKAAEQAYPSECCGLIVGTDTADGWHALAVHETANIAEDKARHFTIDPQAQFDSMRALRGSERRVIGCFHSHPNGAPAPSATDRANAFECDFLWLIAGGSPISGFTLSAYNLVEGAGFLPVALPDDDE